MRAGPASASRTWFPDHAGIARYQAQIAQAIPAGDADLRAAIISAVILGVTVSRHLSSPTSSPPGVGEAHLYPPCRQFFGQCASR